MPLKLLHFLFIFAVHVCHGIKQPNIVFIVGDDIGWNDVSLHGSNQIMTPNIDMLGHHGVVIQNYYTDAQGTPSRSAMLTGKYPMNMGTQGISIGAAEDRGLPVIEKLLPAYLQDLGYITHLVGKWDLGKSREHFLPTYRGFDAFYGFLGSSIDYHTYNHVASCNGSQLFGLDFFNNSEPMMYESGHLTEVLTHQAIKIIKEHDTALPLYLHVAHAAAHIGGGLVNLQAPESFIAANNHIAHSARRTYAGLIASVDESLGAIVLALAETEMINNTVIVFVSDNGAPVVGTNQNFGSNLPLRGTKGTPWEGAVRTTAVLWHNDIEPQIWRGLFHVTDWMPTIISAAGGNISNAIDGIDQWRAIVNRHKYQPRTEAVVAVDDLNGWGAYRDGDLKLIVGRVDKCCSEYYNEGLSEIRYEEPLYEKSVLESQTATVFRELLYIDLNISKAQRKRNLCTIREFKPKVNNTPLCIPTSVKGCLFNITADPGETKDLWYEKPEVVKNLTLRFRLLWAKIKARRLPSFDRRANPKAHDYIWYPWLDCDEPSPEPLMIHPEYPMRVSTEEFQHYMGLSFEDMKNKLNIYVSSLTDTLVDKFKNLF